MENDPCEHVVWEGRGPLASHARVEYRFDQMADGTDFSYVNEYDLPGGPLGTRRRARRLARHPKGGGRFLAAPKTVSRVTVNG